MSRPVQFHVGGTIYWVILTRDPDTMVLKDADSTPTVAIRKNGSSSGDSVTITKRSATTGIYDCSYNPASESEGDFFEFEESATVTGTTTASATYRNNWSCVALAVERGTDSAALASGVNVTQIAGAAVSTSTAQIGVNVVNAGGTAWGSGAITASSIASDAITSAKIATDAIGAAQIAANAIGSSEIADGAITAAKIANDAITDAKVASDVTIASVTGSVGSVTSGVTVTTNNDKTDYALSTSGIAAIWDALTSGLTTASSIGKLLVDNINATISSRASQTSVDTIDDYVDTEIAAIKTVTDKLDTAMELDGAVYRFTTNALEQAPSGGGSTDWTSDERTAIRSILGIPSSGTTPDDPTSGILDTIRDKVDAVDDFVDTEVSAIKTVTDKLDTAMELDGLVYRFTTNALEQAPSGGGGGTTDWTSDERTAIRAILGIPGSGTTPADPTSGILDTIRDKIDTVDDFIDTEVAAIKSKTDNLPASPAATGDIPSASTIATQVRTELTTELTRIDANISSRLEATSYVIPLDAAGIRSAVGIASANLDTQLADIPTVSEFNARTLVSSDYFDASVDQVIVATNNDKTGYSLTSGTGLGNQTANITGNLSGSVGSVTAAVTVGTNNDKTGYGLSTAAIQAIWDALTSALTSVGSIGKLLIDNINATISSRATQTSVDTLDDYLDTEIAAIKAKTDNLPSDPADASDIAAEFVTVNSKLDAIDDFIDTEVASIKTVVDAIETDTQDIQSRIPAALVSGRMDSSVGAMATDTVNAAAIAADAISEIQSGLSTLDAAGVRSAVGLASANLDTQLGDIPTVSEFNARTILAAEYATAANLSIVAGYLDTEIAAIKSKTDNLPSDPADASDIAASFVTVNSKLDAIDNYVDTEVAAIKMVVDAIEVDTQDIQGRLPAALVSGRMDSSVGAMASSVLTAAALATDAVAEMADGVWDEPYAGHTTAGTFGKLMDILRKANMVIDGVVSNAISPTTTQFSSNVNYPTGAFTHAVLLWVNGSSIAEQNSPILTYVNTNGVITVEEAFTAAPQVGDEFVIIPSTHVHSIVAIQNGLATSSGVTAAFTEIKGAGWSSATDTLEEIAVAAGRSTVTVAPLQAVAPDRVSGTEVMTFINDVSAIGPIAVTDADGVAVDLSALTLKVCIEKIDGTILANVTPSISGISNNQVTFTPTAESVAKTGTFRWSLRRTSNNQVYAYGDFIVDAAARIS